MKQPDLGITVARLRTQKGLTQEQLAECCEVSKRTIQRIENGSVDPRTYTLNNLGNVLEFDFGLEGEQKDDLWLTLMHLSSCFFLGIIIVPLLIWSGKKHSSSRIDEHGRAVLNFQITIALILFSVVILLLIPLAVTVVAEERGGAVDLAYIVLAIISSLSFIIIGLFSTFQGVLNAGRMLADKAINYRLSIPFVK